jgi:anti-sigma-K factor RskA
MRKNRHDQQEREAIMNCHEVEELLGAYVLEALSDEERRTVDAHLVTCPQCPKMVQQLQAIVDVFPLTVPAIDPSPQVKERILDRISRAEAARQPTRAIHVTPAVPPAGKPRSWRNALLVATLVVLFGLVGALFTWNLVLDQQVARLSARVNPPVVYTIHGTDASVVADGQVLYYASQNLTVLIIRNLPPLKGTEVYQGWLLRGQQPTSIGLFNVQHGVATLDFPGTIAGYDTAAVSLEAGPRATSIAPQGPVVALATLGTT